MTSFYVSDRQIAAFPEAAGLFKAVGSILAAEEKAHVEAEVYARVVRDLLAVVGKPTINTAHAYDRPLSYSLDHPDSRVRDALRGCSYYPDQLRALGLIEAREEPK